MRAKSTATSKGYHHGNLRDALLETARTLLEERGPSFLTLREIARRVGVSAPAAYHHFPNLEAIAFGLAEKGASEMGEALAMAARKSDAGLVQLGEAYVAFARANPALYRLMFGEGFTPASKVGAKAQTLRRRTYELIEDRLKSHKSGDDLASAAFFLWSLTHGLSLLLIDGQINARALSPGFVRQVLRLASTGISGGPKNVRN